MSDPAISIPLLQVIVTALGTAGLGGVLLSWWNSHQSRKAKVSGDERKARETMYTDLVRENRLRAAQLRVMDDYAHALRVQLSEAGIVPRPWPEALNELAD